MAFYRLLAVSISVGAVIFSGLLYWYQWSAHTLSDNEIDAYLSTIEAQAQSPGGKHDMIALRAFLESDDGRPVYTVNLYKFHDKAAYTAGAGFTGTGEQAYDRFSRVMISLMAERSSHPIYGSSWVDASSDWDRIVVVRYRSRRDLVDLFATDAFADASLHKWASIREHQRMLVQATHIPDGKYLFFILAFLASAAVYILIPVFTRSSAPN
jgi:hypothetical protein